MANSKAVISRSLMISIKAFADRALSGEKTVDLGMVEIGAIVDAYNEFFCTGRGKVSRKGEVDGD